ncbi:unnamed protein product [Urochloa humidicola]
MANEEQPDWSSLPLDLLPLIGQRSRDAVTGVAAFRSVCRAWRAAVGPAPRLLLPRASSEPDHHALVFPHCHAAGPSSSTSVTRLAASRTSPRAPRPPCPSSTPSATAAAAASRT